MKITTFRKIAIGLPFTNISLGKVNIQSELENISKSQNSTEHPHTHTHTKHPKEVKLCNTL